MCIHLYFRNGIHISDYFVSIQFACKLFLLLLLMCVSIFANGVDVSVHAHVLYVQLAGTSTCQALAGRMDNNHNFFFSFLFLLSLVYLR